MSSEGQPDPPALPVDRAIATLLLSIDQDLAAKVLQHFSDDAVDKVTRAMQALQDQSVDGRVVQQVWQQASQRLRRADPGLGDVGGAMRSVLVKAFGESRGTDFNRRASGDILAKKPFAMFEALTAEDLANLLTEEHPQIAAVFMAHLDRKKGGEVLKFPSRPSTARRPRSCSACSRSCARRSRTWASTRCAPSRRPGSRRRRRS
jgi:flagellar motor switch protein FliG